MKKITLIYSGGSDSFTLLHRALNQNFSVDCITFNYGQKHAKEIDFAINVCKELNLKHTLIDIGDPSAIFGSSSLVDRDNKIPYGSYKEDSMKSTIVPNRNMIFISYAIAYSIANKISEVWYGAHAGDHFIYPDCRPEFLQSMDVAFSETNTPFGLLTVSRHTASHPPRSDQPPLKGTTERLSDFSIIA